jgi:hypothetical protein
MGDRFREEERGLPLKHGGPLARFGAAGWGCLNGVVHRERLEACSRGSQEESREDRIRQRKYKDRAIEVVRKLVLFVKDFGKNKAEYEGGHERKTDA